MKRNKQQQFIGVLYLFIALLLYRNYGWTDSMYLKLGVMTPVFVALFFIPALIYPVLVFWFLIGKFIGEIVSTILLSVLYFALIWPVKFFVSPLPKGGWHKREDQDKDYLKMG